MSRLFNAKTWTTADGRTLRYEDMKSTHRLNALNHLLRHAQWHVLNYWMSVPMPNGEHALDDVERMIDDAAEDPYGWILDTPCGSRLLELVRADGLVHRVVANRGS